MNENELIYWTVLGPGRKLIANFSNEEGAHEFRARVVTARLAQLERLKSALTEGEYRGEYNFRKNGIAIKKVVVQLLGDEQASRLTDEDLVDGSFLIISDRWSQ